MARPQLFVLCALVALAACRVGDGPMTVDYDGRIYEGIAGEHFVVSDDDVLPMGAATRIEPASAVADETVFQVVGIPVERLIALRGASDQPADFLLFVDAEEGFLADLCQRANPANPPAEADCPRP